MPGDLSDWDAAWGPEQDPEPTTINPKPLSVAQLLTCINETLAAALPRVLVRGEIHALKAAMSGHLYLDLKDEESDAIVHCCLWSSRRRRLSFMPRQGDLVDVTGSLDIYAPRGSLSLIIDSMRPAGEGALWAKFLALKEKLSGEGLFDPERKKPLPAYPKVVGIVTSSWAAALRDVLRTLHARAPGVSVILYPAAVQGEGAEEELIAALKTADERAECDVVLLVRGGGSLADLWTFNSEALAHQIAAMNIPVVSGVGHATDTSISDLVADATAVTPTAAAELVTQNWVAAPDLLSGLETRLTHCMDRELQLSEGRLTGALRLTPIMQQRLAEARTALAEQANVEHAFEAFIGNCGRRLDSAALSLAGGPSQMLLRARNTFSDVTERLQWQAQNLGKPQKAAWEELTQRLSTLTPNVAPARLQVERDALVLAQLVRGRVRLARERVTELAAQVRALDGREVLKRGYAVVRNAQGKAVTEAQSLKVSDCVSLTFAHGEAQAAVTKVKPAAPDTEHS